MTFACFQECAVIDKTTTTRMPIQNNRWATQTNQQKAY
jgi:hypothetical protein